MILSMVCGSNINKPPTNHNEPYGHTVLCVNFNSES